MRLYQRILTGGAIALLTSIQIGCGGNGAQIDADSGGNSSGNGGNGSDGTGNTTPVVVAQLTANHRSGQTFLLWPETHPAASYHIYRYNQPITQANLDAATQLTERWGALDQDSSVNKHATDAAPRNFVVEDLQAPLGDDTGLFVHTVQDDQAGAAYYAVTSVLNGTENTTITQGVNALDSAINESVANPAAVLTTSLNGGKGRLYTQYMDYANWNPTFNGYAYNYSVALPFNYDPSRAYPLQIQLHGFGVEYKFPEQSEFDWQVIQIFAADPGAAQNAVHSWWYGYAADHNYNTDGTIPTQGTIENFTEQRIMRSIRDVTANSEINVNEELIHMYGHSMGGSGSVSFGLRYSNVLAGIYASEPMTNYRNSPLFQDNFVQLWGNQSSNLPIVNRGADSDPIRRYGQGGDSVTGVWDWMNHQQQLTRRNADDFAYLMIDHGKSDTTIDWQTQGRPIVRALTDAKAAFSASALGGIEHTWLAFSSVVTPLFGLGFDNEAPWRYSNSLSFPAIHNASSSGAIDPGPSGDDFYNTNIEWSTPNTNFDQDIVDTNNRYEISLRSFDGDQTADITPRNTQAFNPSSGQNCNWSATRNNNGQAVGSGSITVDGSGLATATGVLITNDNGTRLIISC